MPELYEYSVGDHVVIRMECNNEQRWGKVIHTYSEGSCLCELSPRGRIRISARGLSSLGTFTLIKHVPVAEVVEPRGGLNGIQQKYQDPRIPAWLAQQARGRRG